MLSTLTTLPRPFPHRRSAEPPHRPRVRGLMLGTLLLLGGAASAQAQSLPQRPGEPGLESWERQQAQALERLSGWQRRTYFQDRRTLERRQSDQRLALLGQSERCLDQARGLQAIRACQQREQLDRAEQRRRQMEEWSQLRQRYGLPVPEPRTASAGRWSPYDATPSYSPYSPQPTYPSSPGYRPPYPAAPQASGPSTQGRPDSWLDLLFGF